MRNHRIGGHLHPQMVRYGIPWPIPPVFSEASQSKMKPAAMLNRFQRFRSCGPKFKFREPMGTVDFEKHDGQAWKPYESLLSTVFNFDIWTLCPSISQCWYNSVSLAVFISVPYYPMTWPMPIPRAKFFKPHVVTEQNVNLPIGRLVLVHLGGPLVKSMMNFSYCKSLWHSKPMRHHLSTS